ncbi:PEP-CTERM/exosortase system-associated acyltransferase [Rheinheimera maricola]|uniref:PEP-CTERM/exosortase system-associated acyltransferase n=1 Tax=Rheinheimera maricola TaxID=2793282 RepID=A0ABS7XBX5_9GAMM|nr:PEP-CTERM/exosortase system-associated acyltransferase [Rheinheimera maricola]MBZ9612555.1 PEP-CTERM/exosortase system-associated acyltransferase [Rheinheimera maricola]
MSSLVAVSDIAFLHSAPLQPVASQSVEHYCPLQYFPDFYQARLPRTAEQYNDTFRLRHQVYCEELSYEPVRADKLERDQFDLRAIHCAITQNASNKLAGTVRLITSAAPDQLLPVESYFGTNFTNPALAPSNFPRHNICEISRLAVPKDIRRSQLIEVSERHPGLPAVESQCRKLVSVALYLLATLMCVRDDRYHAYVMIEPSLARVLKRVGIHFIQIGDAIDFNGSRAPYYVDMRTTKSTLKADYLALRNALDSQLFDANEEYENIGLQRAVG